MSTNKKVYIELMRIIAAWLVIFNHLKGYLLFIQTTGSKQWIYIVLSMITRINVPVFFMISGMLLLGRNITYSDIGKKIGRILIYLITFEILITVAESYMQYRHMGILTFDLVVFLRSILAGNIYGAGAYWFLYAYIAFLLMLPLLEKIAININAKDISYIIIIHFICFTALPIINLVLYFKMLDEIVLNSYIVFPFGVLKCIFYPLIGYYLDKKINIEDLGWKPICLSVVVSCCGIAISGMCTLAEGMYLGRYSENFTELFDYITAITFFLLIKRIISKGKMSVRTERKIILWGSLTFGIYLIDPVLKVILFNKYISFFRGRIPLISSIIWCFVSMCLGGTITYI